MSGPSSPITPSGPSQAEFQTLHATQYGVAVSLASAIIAASGRPHSIEEALEVCDNVYNAMFPQPSHGRYQAWVKNKDAILKKVHT